MDDISRRIRQANPHKEGDLPESGRRLLRTLEAEHGWQPVQQAKQRSFWAPVFALSAVAAVLVLTAFVVIGMFPGGSSVEHAATPQPLEVEPNADSLADLQRQIQLTQFHGASESVRGFRLTEWHLQTTDEASAAGFIAPRVLEASFDENGVGVLRVYAGTPLYEQQNPVLPLPEGIPEPGALLDETTWDAGELFATFPDPPPDTALEMRRYLEGYLVTRQPAENLEFNAGDYGSAIIALMKTWTLSDSAQRAAIEVLLHAEGTGLSGSTFDRDGRAGALLELAAGSSSDGENRNQFIIDTSTWQILAVETTSVAGIPKRGVPPGAVVAYTVWNSTTPHSKL